MGPCGFGLAFYGPFAHGTLFNASRKCVWDSNVFFLDYFNLIILKIKNIILTIFSFRLKIYFG
jgi:hypothetical protein